MRTHYVGHDDIYKKNKAAGKNGWDPAEISEAVLEQYKELLQHDSVPKSGRLLELGCGAGNLSVGFAQLGYQVTGVDIAPSAVEWARERAKDQQLTIDFLVDNVVELTQLKLNDFDLVIDSHCLHCIIGDDRRRFFATVQRTLKPGAVFVVNTMCQNERSHEIQGFQPESGLTVHGDIATRYVGKREDIEAELKAAGFKIIESRLFLDDSGSADDLLLILQRS